MALHYVARRPRRRFLGRAIPAAPIIIDAARSMLREYWCNALAFSSAPGGEAIAAEERLEERHPLLTGRSQGPIGWRADQMDAHMLRLRGAATRVDVLR